MAAPQAPAAPATWLEEHSQYIEVPLSRPVRDNGQDVHVLRIRQPVVQDLSAVDADVLTNPIAMLSVVLASCAGVSHTAVRTLTISDMTRCAEALGKLGFTIVDAYTLLGQQLLSALQTGPNGSP